MDDLKDKLYEFITNATSHHAVTEEKLDKIEKHTKETNGRVSKLEAATRHLEKDLDKHVVDIHNEISSIEQRMKIWTLKALVIVSLLGSLIWIKESRDVIIEILRSFT